MLRFLNKHCDCAQIMVMLQETVAPSYKNETKESRKNKLPDEGKS